MILADGLILGLVISLLTGGSLNRLRDVRLHGEPILVVGLALHVSWPVIAEGLDAQTHETLLVWALSAVLLLGLGLANSQLLGMSIAALGIAMNLVVVLVNGGMPVDIDAATRDGEPVAAVQEAIAESPLHIVQDDSTRLAWMADRIYIPGPEWHRGMASPGDLLLSCGAGLAVFRLTRRKAEGL